MAGKGALPCDHPLAVGAMGVTGASAANALAREADLVLGVGTRWTDFSTASRTAFQNPGVGFVNLNVARVDGLKLGGLALVADARAGLDALADSLPDWSAPAEWRARATALAREWNATVEALVRPGPAAPPSQAEVIGAVNRFADPGDVVVCAAGSLPGDLHKLWRARDPKSFHVEYGYSCMGYEVAGGLGVKLAAPEREVYVLVGDGSWLMMSSEIVTSIQERAKLVVVLIDNRGFASIGGLSESLGSGGFGTRYRYREPGAADLSGEPLPVDLAANAASLGAHALCARSVVELEAALKAAKGIDRSVVIAVETDPERRVGSFDSWWDVPVAEVSEQAPVREARARYERELSRERWLT